MVELLEQYGVEMKEKGNQWQGFCPLPSHEGKRKSPSFSVNTERNIWKCFSCGAQGNVIDFAARMEGLDPDNPAEFRKAALLLQERYLADAPAPEAKTEAPAEDTAEDETASEEETTDEKRNVVINAPLDFALKRLDPAHPYLLEKRGLRPETVEYFGLGYCSKGLMAGRIAIPLHDATGNLVGYAGRLVDDEAIDEDHPKYRFPSTRKRDGTLYEFRKGLFVYNGFRIAAPVKDLVVVEGFFGVFHLYQTGYQNVVALMGSSCSDEQAGLLVKMTSPDGRIWWMPDGDDAGRRCAGDVLLKVAPYCFIRWLKLEEGQQPEDCSLEDLAAWLGPSENMRANPE